MLMRSPMATDSAARDPVAAADAAPQDSGSAGRDVLAGFLGLIVRLCGARAGAVRKLAANNKSLELVASVGLPVELRRNDLSRPATCGVCGGALDSGDPQRTTIEVGCSVCGSASWGDLRHALAVPLHDQERAIGVLNLFFHSASSVPHDALEMLRPFGPVLGDATLFTRSDEVEEQWKLVDAIVGGWRRHAPTLPNYAAGTWGPAAADDLVHLDGRSWRRH